MRISPLTHASMQHYHPESVLTTFEDLGIDHSQCRAEFQLCDPVLPCIFCIHEKGTVFFPNLDIVFRGGYRERQTMICCIYGDFGSDTLSRRIVQVSILTCTHHTGKLPEAAPWWN